MSLPHSKMFDGSPVPSQAPAKPSLVGALVVCLATVNWDLLRVNNVSGTAKSHIVTALLSRYYYPLYRYGNRGSERQNGVGVRRVGSEVMWPEFNPGCSH